MPSLPLTTIVFEVIPKKKKFKEQGKAFKFEEIKTADYSYAKKPSYLGEVQ